MQRLILLFALMSFTSFGQQAFNNTDIVDVYQPSSTELGEAYFKIPVNFNADDLLKVIPPDLSDVSIQRIDLVYTVYKTSPTFEQEKLNDNRVNHLKKAWPTVSNNLINWNCIGQAQATNSEDAKAMFHGFYVYYRPIPTKESMEAELAYIDEILFGASAAEVEDKIEERKEAAEPILTSDDPSAESEVIEFADFLTGGLACYQAVKQQVVGETGFQMALDSVQELPGFFGYSSSTVEGLKRSRKPTDVIWYFRLDSCDLGAGSSTHSFAYSTPKDYSVVEAVFERNPTWTNSLIVMDVTGSMSSYIAKTMAWVKASQNNPKVSAFVFFNDGDLKATNQKIMGKVGGIYSTPNTEFNSVYEIMKRTMQNGGGGDCPENNLEATLYGIEKYGDCDEVIMVADNWATPRDLEMVAELKVPIHIILCGADYGINIEYIQLAIDSGGSIHTIEEDLDTRNIKPGVAFELGNAFYTIVNGRVVKAENK